MIANSMVAHTISAVGILTVVLLSNDTQPWAASAVQVSPSTIAADARSVVTVTANVATGQDVTVSFVADFAGNGSLDEIDAVIHAYVLEDAPLPSVHHSGMVLDRDGAQNGRIQVTVPFYGAPHIVGQYLVVVDDGQGQSTTPFTIATPAGWEQTIAGNVVLEGVGQPALIEVLYEQGDFELKYGAFTDDTGTFEIAFPIEGELAVAAIATGFITDFDGGSVAEVNVQNGQTVTLTESLQLFTAPYSLGGQVQITDGQETTGVPALFLLAESESDEGEFLSLAWTDANGNFTLPTRNGDVEIFFENLNARGLVVPTDERTVDDSDVTGVIVNAEAIQGVIAGSVNNEEAGSEMHLGLEIIVDDYNRNLEIKDVYTDSDGDYTVGVIEGNWSVSPASDVLGLYEFTTHAPSSRQVSVTEGETVGDIDFTITLASAFVTVQVRLGSESGNPAEEVGVMIFTADTHQFLLYQETDDNGNARIPLEPGTYVVEVEQDFLQEQGYVMPPTTTFTLTEGETETVTLALQEASAGVTLTLRDPAGDPLSGINLFVNLVEGETRTSSGGGNTDEQGRVTVPLSAGNYEAGVRFVSESVAPNGFTSPSQPFTLSDSGQGSVDMVLYIYEAVLQISALDGTGQPVNTYLSVVDQTRDEAIAGVWTDTSGNATVPVPAIPLNVSIDANTIPPHLTAPTAQSVTPQVDETLNLTFTFETSVTPQPLSADLNGDRVVNEEDLLILMSQWHQTW